MTREDVRLQAVCAYERNVMPRLMFAYRERVFADQGDRLRAKLAGMAKRGLDLKARRFAAIIHRVALP